MVLKICSELFQVMFSCLLLGWGSFNSTYDFSRYKKNYYYLKFTSSDKIHSFIYTYVCVSFKLLKQYLLTKTNPFFIDEFVYYSSEITRYNVQVNKYTLRVDF